MTHITSITLTLGGLSVVLRSLVTVFSSNSAMEAIKSGICNIFAVRTTESEVAIGIVVLCCSRSKMLSVERTSPWDFPRGNLLQTVLVRSIRWNTIAWAHQTTEGGRPTIWRATWSEILKNIQTRGLDLSWNHGGCATRDTCRTTAFHDTTTCGRVDLLSCSQQRNTRSKVAGSHSNNTKSRFMWSFLCSTRVLLSTRNWCESFRIKPKPFQIEPKSPNSCKLHRICRIQGYRLEDSVVISSRLEWDRNRRESFRIKPKHHQIEPKSTKYTKIHRTGRIKG